MKQENVYTATQVEELLDSEFVKFEKQWHGLLKTGDLQTLAKFIEQVKAEASKPRMVLCSTTKNKTHNTLN